MIGQSGEQVHFGAPKSCSATVSDCMNISNRISSRSLVYFPLLASQPQTYLAAVSTFLRARSENCYPTIDYVSLYFY